MPKKQEKDNPLSDKKLHRLQVGSKNFISQLFFIWVFPFIFRLRLDKSNFKNIELFLRESESADYNDEILENKWQEEVEQAKKENRFKLYFKLYQFLGLDFLVFFISFYITS